MTETALPTVLTIAGSDCSAGAGIQADLKTIHALGGYALTVISAITAQNSQAVLESYPLTASQIKQQLEALSADYDIGVVKIGMLGNQEVVKTVVDWLKATAIKTVILDPIIVSSSGKTLLEPSAIQTLKQELLPLCSLITPNLPELNLLINGDYQKLDNKQVLAIQIQLHQNNWPNTLLKGGHSLSAKAEDILFLKEDMQIQRFSAARLQVQHSHGTGCTLSSAIACFQAKEENLSTAIKLAKDYLSQALASADRAQPQYKKLSPPPQRRRGGLNHFYSFADQNATGPDKPGLLK